MIYKLSSLGTLLGLLGVAGAKTLFVATDYASQSGTNSHSGKTTVGWFDNNDYLTYASANFGPSGTTKAIRINYSKGTHNGRVEVRLGVGTTGQLIGEFKPASTSGWHNFMTSYIDIEDVEGVHDITLVAKDIGGVLDLAWFELADFSDRADIYTRIPATEYSDQNGIQFVPTDSEGNMQLGHYYSGDYITYSNVNFGASGTSDLLRMEFTKGNHGGKVVLKLDGPNGTTVGEFNPYNTGGWGSPEEGHELLEDVVGIHDLTFVAEGSGVFDLVWFELSKKIDLYPKKSLYVATDYFTQGGTQSHSGKTTVGWFDNNDYLTYASANFGPSGTTKAIRINYSKGTHNGRVEVRLGVGTTGQLLGEFKPASTSGWHNFMTSYIDIEDVEGVHDITLVAKDIGGVLDLAWFEL